MNKKKMIIAGGGTGGHIYPGLAIATEWKKRGYEVLFVGTIFGMESKLIPKHGFPLQLLKVGSIKGRNFFNKVKSIFKLFSALILSFKILRKEKPLLVLGIGGYASGPLVLMASLLGYPTAIMEQNAHPGFTNRTLGKFVDLIFLTFKESEVFFKKSKVKILGNPVLEDRMPSFIAEENKLGLTLLICGGSQGAHFINELMIQLYPQLKSKFQHLEIIHQTGMNDYQRVKKEKEKIGISGIVKDYFEEMHTLYQKADLIITRAGAGSLTEISLWGIPAILIPYPYAADNHQMKNAASYAAAKAALIFDQNDFDEQKFKNSLVELLENKDLRLRFKENMLRLSKPQARLDIADQLEKLIHV